MAKMTVLEIVQDIISDMNDDEINSITDTIESLQVAQIVKSTYFEMMGNKNWPHLRKLDNLDASGDNTKPTHMGIPEDVREVEWVEYNMKKVGDNRNYFEQVKFVTPDEFLRRTSLYDNTLATVDVITDYSGVTFHIKNDKNPEFCTSFDDENIVFNSYDSVLDTTLQRNKSRISVYAEPTWGMADTFVPDMPVDAFPALLAEAKSVAFARLKQSPDQKAEQQAIRQKSWMSRKAWKIGGGIKLPDYSRRSRK